MTNEPPKFTHKNSSLGISQALENDQPKKLRRSTTLLSDSFKEPSEHDTCFGWAGFYMTLYLNKIAVNIFGGVTGWKWYNRIDELVILGALPTPTQIKEMQQQQNLKTVVNLCAEFPGYRGLYQELNIQQMRLGTADYTVPTLDKIEVGVSAIMDIAEHRDGSIYIHCKAGRGRSAALGLCYLIRRYELNPQQAQSVLIKARAQVDKELYHAEQIRMYYKSIIMEAEGGRIHRIPYTFM
ncbi:hypothetical protein INT44_000222 [Umbelopsis vinacea]|uniref:Protein-tyrosine-phosphatase n=1 Tax=Umbelopsis vinacea TaxID=44442 RepID=A0A8H7PLN3_9FUNG|nr:hypothetical protein INT44_000222 [Umbelopsis vinacea]